MSACFWPRFSVVWPPFLPSCWHGSCGTRVPACWRHVSSPSYQATYHALWLAHLTMRASPFLPCSLPTTYGWVRLKYNSSLVQFFLTVVLKITAQWKRRLSVRLKDFEYSAWVMRTGFMILLRTVLKWLKTYFSKCCSVPHGWNKKLTLIDIHHIFSAEWQDSWNGCSGSILCLFWRCDF